MFSPKTQDQGTIVLAQQDYLPIVVDSFLIDRGAQGLSPDTISFYRKRLAYVQDYCEAQAVAQTREITPGLSRRFVLQLLKSHYAGGEPACSLR